MGTIFYRNETLEAVARNTLLEFNENYLIEKPQAIPLEKIIEEHGLNIEYKYLTNNGRELGRMIYDDGYTTYYDTDINDYNLLKISAGTIMIDARLLECPNCFGRYRFTLAHEFAHWLIHQMVFTTVNEAAALYEHNDDDDESERQANALATALLMPAGQIKKSFYSVRHNLTSKKDIITEMAKIFEVSKQSMSFRLEHFALI